MSEVVRYTGMEHLYRSTLMRDGRQLAEGYRALFAEYCVELDCWTHAVGQIAAREYGLSDKVDDAVALGLPDSLDIDGILHSAARLLAKKLVKHAARAFAPPGGRPLHIRTNDFSNHWARNPQQFDPVALWEALERRFAAQTNAQASAQMPVRPGSKATMPMDQRTGT